MEIFAHPTFTTLGTTKDAFGYFKQNIRDFSPCGVREPIIWKEQKLQFSNGYFVVKKQYSDTKYINTTFNRFKYECITGTLTPIMMNVCFIDTTLTN